MLGEGCRMLLITLKPKTGTSNRNKASRRSDISGDNIAQSISTIASRNAVTPKPTSIGTAEFP